MHDHNNSELIIGLVGPVGTDIDQVYNLLRLELVRIGYIFTEPIRLISLLENIDKDSWPFDKPNEPVEDRYHRLMTAGNDFRELAEDGGALAVLSLGAIREQRKALTANPKKPAPRTAYIIRSLKHPGEAQILRDIYGPSFVLIAAYSSREKRVSHLSQRIAGGHMDMDEVRYRSEAEKLIIRDEKENGLRMGQNVQDTFPLADVFIDVNVQNTKDSFSRLIELLFGNTIHTPTKDEFGMFHAWAAALRSADLSRQVGAVITTPDGDISAVGVNEVPKAGGGLYWSDEEDDHRDYKRGLDSNEQKKRILKEDLFKQLCDHGWFSKSKSKKSIEKLVDEAFNNDDSPLREAQLNNLTEYGRPVHAEMSAIIDAARRGIAVKGCFLYTTTFPCHNCARHIIAAGIKRIVYIEPYPKSIALNLHDDAIVIDAPDYQGNKVVFQPFVGVSPNRYMELFKMLRRKNVDGTYREWQPKDARLRYSGHLLRYITLEDNNIDKLKVKLEKKKIKMTI